MLFETHSHLNFPQFESDLPEVIQRAKDAGVSEILVVGTDKEGNQKALRIAHDYNLWAAVGIHPSDADSGPLDLAEIKNLVQDQRVVAIGETGLDYASSADKEKQATLFHSLRGIAGENGLPVLIHSRQASEETLRVLTQYAPLRGVWHCFSGDEDLAQKVLALGLFVSFTANITYKKNGALRQVVKYVPLSRLLLETDCPFLPPDGKRGLRNEPAWLTYLAGAIAEIKGVPVEKVAEETFNNSSALFLKKNAQNLNPDLSSGQPLLFKIDVPGKLR